MGESDQTPPPGLTEHAEAVAGPQEKARRRFLVVVDESAEMPLALRYATRRAAATDGDVVLLRVLEPPDFQQWKGVEDMMRAEQEDEAQELLQHYAMQVQQATGRRPATFIREGKADEQLLALMDSEPGISVLVLAVAADAEGPGPLISAIIGGHGVGKLSVPVTLVPGSVAREKLDEIT